MVCEKKRECNLIAFHFALTAFLTSQHKNFPIVRHFLKDSLKVVTAFQLVLLSLLGKIIEVTSCSGAVAEKVRQAGRKSPCQWQS